MTNDTSKRPTARPLATALALAAVLAATTHAIAHIAYPDNVSGEYAAWTDEDDNTVEVTWTGPPLPVGSVPAPVYVNWCKAKRILPPNWNRQPGQALSTRTICAEEPLYGTGGKKLTETEANTMRFTLAGSHEPERYIASVSFGAYDPTHHGGGEHTTIELVRLDTPEDENGFDPVSPVPGLQQTTQ